MAEVGTVTVKVLPDLSEFEPAIRAYIQRIAREEIAAVLDVVSERGGYRG